jgi:hypothetical protein
MSFELRDIPFPSRRSGSNQFLVFVTLNGKISGVLVDYAVHITEE